MGMEKTLDKLRSFYADHGVTIPHGHVVLGSVMSKVADPKAQFSGWTYKGHLNFSEVPGLVSTTAPGHKGVFSLFVHPETKKSFVLQIGRIHGFEGIPAREAVKPVMFHRQIGIKNFILMNAAGSLQKNIGPSSVMIIRDQVNLSGQNPLTGPNPSNVHGEPLGPRFPDMSQIYDVEVGNGLKDAFKKSGLEVHEGTYVSVLGPSFETPAEIRLFSQWGLHAVGMSTVWEAIALKHSGARVAGVSFITNYGCGLTNSAPLDHDAFEKLTEGSALKVVQGLFAFLKEKL